MKVMTREEWEKAMEAINILQQFFDKAEDASYNNAVEAEEVEEKAYREYEEAEEVDGAPLAWYESYRKPYEKAMNEADLARELNDRISDLNTILEKAEGKLTEIRWTMGFED